MCPNQIAPSSTPRQRPWAAAAGVIGLFVVHSHQHRRMSWSPKHRRRVQFLRMGVASMRRPPCDIARVEGCCLSGFWFPRCACCIHDRHAWPSCPPSRSSGRCLSARFRPRGRPGITYPHGRLAHGGVVSVPCLLEADRGSFGSGPNSGGRAARKFVAKSALNYGIWVIGAIRCEEAVVECPEQVLLAGSSASTSVAC